MSSRTDTADEQVPSDGLERLRRILGDMGSVLVAYSGGIDSALVLKVAHDTLGSSSIGVTAVSPTYPSGELEIAKRVAREIGARHEIVETDQLAIPDFVENDSMRCFHCKTDLYRLLQALREPRACRWVVDGTNLDDLGDDRPGIAAARRLNVRSPLVEAHLSKADVRSLAKHLGVSIWDKPAAACLSSRIPRGVPITMESLRRVEQAEAVLQQEGLRQVRVRDHGDIARIEIAAEEFEHLFDRPDRRRRISERLRAAGFRFVCVDLEGYRPGGVSLG
ncbi:MAG TPA: ATP-dependent sacrificial sulfur transferase LarE [Nitrospira sp.]|nr:ATP-dependent sacrificial sulfur transferase LarE [Nitrospira sp.]